MHPHKVSRILLDLVCVGCVNKNAWDQGEGWSKDKDRDDDRYEVCGDIRNRDEVRDQNKDKDKDKDKDEY